MAAISGIEFGFIEMIAIFHLGRIMVTILVSQVLVPTLRGTAVLVCVAILVISSRLSAVTATVVPKLIRFCICIGYGHVNSPVES